MTCPSLSLRSLLLRFSAGAVVAGVTPALADVPENDDPAGATVITEFPFFDALYTTEATAGSGDPDSACNWWLGAHYWFAHSVWYVWTPDESVDVALSTFGSDFDTIASVWTWDGTTWTEMACSDQACGESANHSFVEFSAVAGTTYYMMVTDWNEGPGGYLEVTLDEPAASPPIDGTLDSATTSLTTGETTTAGTITCAEGFDYSVYGSLYQRVGRFVTRAYFSLWGTCGEGETDWTTSFVGWDGVVVGRANYSLSLYGTNSFSGCSEYAEVSGTVRVRSGSGR